MTGADLRREYLCALGVTAPGAWVRLIAAGVPEAAIRLTVPALARIAVHDGLFEPDADGGEAFVTPVRVDDPIGPEAIDPAAALADGDIVDLVAFHPAPTTSSPAGAFAECGPYRRDDLQRACEVAGRRRARHGC